MIPRLHLLACRHDERVGVDIHSIRLIMLGSIMSNNRKDINFHETQVFEAQIHLAQSPKCRSSAGPASRHTAWAGSQRIAELWNNCLTKNRYPLRTSPRIRIQIVRNKP